jgi:hypothetical protein
MFLRHFPLVADLEEGKHPHKLEGAAVCHTSLSIQDMSTYNLAYDRLGVLKAIAPQAWLRAIAGDLSHDMGERHSTDLPVSVSDLEDDDPLLRGCELWVTDPDLVRYFRGSRTPVMPVEATLALGLRGVVGQLWLSPNIHVETREMSDRWDVIATVAYTLLFDPTAIRYLPLVGFAHTAVLETPPTRSAFEG